MPLYYVTLQSGRTDNIYLEADSKNDILSFINAISDVHVSIIKKVVYSVKYKIGTSGALAPNLSPKDKQLFITCSSSKFTTTFEFRFPLKGLDEKFVSEQVKKYLLINDEPVNRIINIVKAENEISNSL